MNELEAFSDAYSDMIAEEMIKAGFRGESEDFVKLAIFRAIQGALNADIVSDQQFDEFEEQVLRKLGPSIEALKARIVIPENPKTLH